MSRIGQNSRADVAVCMAVDCERKAIYRLSSLTQRGYCSRHKGMAARSDTERFIEAQANRLESFQAMTALGREL